MSRFPPPPSGRAPVSHEIIDVVKRKVGPPSSTPPSDMVVTAFKQPKTYRVSISSDYQYDRRNDRQFSDEDEDDDDNDDDDDDDDNRSDFVRSHDRFDDDKKTTYHSNLKVPRRTREYMDSDDDDRDSTSEGTKENSRHTQSRTEVKKYPTNRRVSETNDEKSSYITQPNYLTSISTEPPTTSSPLRSVYAIYGTNDGVFNFEPLLRATYRDLRNFAWAQCDKGVLVKCYIERDRSGSNQYSPLYSLCADMDDGSGRELMVCRKIWKSMKPHYAFSLKSEDVFVKREQRSRLYLGKLRGISPTEYVLYDNGTLKTWSLLSDEDEESVTDSVESMTNETTRRFSSVEEGNDEGSLYRKELAIIAINSKKRPAPAGVRSTEVCVLARNQEYEHSPDEKLSARKRNGPPPSHIDTFRKIRKDGKQNISHRSKMIIINERTSRFDPTSAVMVEHNGRATLASVKNGLFVLSDPVADSNGAFTDDGKEPILAIGKIADDCFNMDFRHPLSLLQAFAICIARFDANLKFQ